MEFFVEVTDFAGRASSGQLRDRIRQVEDLGAAGINLWDHIFTSSVGADGDIHRPCEPLVTMGAIAGLSETLKVQTTVVNSAWTNPSLLLRQFLQLAVFMGGDRVIAGLGAGWNTEEFAAIGERMAPYKARMARLEETFQIGRQLFDTGVANVQGEYVSAVDLPISPRPDVPPKLLTGGGSDRALAIAGRYCDAMDLHGRPKYAAFRGKDLAEKHRNTDLAIIQTTVEDSVEMVDVIRKASVEAGRPADAVAITTQLQYMVICASQSEVRDTEEMICRDYGHVPYRPLNQIPAILVGEKHQIVDMITERKERYGLSRISIKEKDDQIRFLKEVLPLVD